MQVDAPPPMPPVPPDCDLTGFGFMPLEVTRLRRSKAWLICKRRPELAFYMLNLWTASWLERPAGSLEDDDDVLADASMCPPDQWPTIKSDAMRGWVKCSDGRWYHPVVAEKAADAWHERQLHRWSKECDRIRKENKRRQDGGEKSIAYPPRPERTAADVPQDVRQPSTGNPPENALKEGKEGKEGKEDTASAGKRDRKAVNDAASKVLAEEFEIFWQAYPRHVSRGAAERAYRKARQDGIDASVLLQGAQIAARHHAAAKTEAQYIAYPSTWLNAKGWGDEYPAGNGQHINGKAAAYDPCTDSAYRGVDVG